jgi:hypothetical protein
MYLYRLSCNNNILNTKPCIRNQKYCMQLAKFLKNNRSQYGNIYQQPIVVHNFKRRPK